MPQGFNRRYISFLFPKPLPDCLIFFFKTPSSFDFHGVRLYLSLLPVVAVICYPFRNVPSLIDNFITSSFTTVIIPKTSLLQIHVFYLFAFLRANVFFICSQLSHPVVSNNFLPNCHLLSTVWLHFSHSSLSPASWRPKYISVSISLLRTFHTPYNPLYVIKNTHLPRLLWTPITLCHS